MTAMPTISVIMPFLNAEAWIEQALESLLRQDFRDYEIIAVDDGSTDSGTGIVERAAKHDPRIIMLRNASNQGIVHCLNKGLDAARGSFIARMDADDICHPRRLSRQLGFLRASGLDLCGSWYIEFGQGLARTVRRPHSEQSVRAALLFQNPFCHPTVMARREVFEKFHYRHEYRHAEDYDLWARACGEFRAANVPEALLRYRQHHAQITQSRRDEVETVAGRIRLEALHAQGIHPTEMEREIHNLIRAPRSIRSIGQLKNIETWLMKLLGHFDDAEARKIIASEWVRACIRAAPLGSAMWNVFRSSSLREHLGKHLATAIDLRILSVCKLDYASKAFATLRKLGLSA